MCVCCMIRVSDSDDLKMTESEVGRMAVSIEKEMFNLCMNTDSKYKNKYRSLMFNLKDPKNKVSGPPKCHWPFPYRLIEWIKIV